MKVYARVANEQIIEYPVYEIHIRNRKHPIEWYTECIVATKPSVPKFHHLKELKTVANGKVYVTYEIVPQTLENLLSSIKGPVVPGETPAPVLASDLTSDVVQRVIKLGDEYVTKKLTDFAATKGYDSIVSAVSYETSTVAEFRAHAAKIKQLRDTIWVDLPVYINSVVTNAVPFPTSIADIDAVLPAFVWE